MLYRSFIYAVLTYSYRDVFFYRILIIFSYHIIDSYSVLLYLSNPLYITKPLNFTRYDPIQTEIKFLRDRDGSCVKCNLNETFGIHIKTTRNFRMKMKLKNRRKCTTGL